MATTSESDMRPLVLRAATSLMIAAGLVLAVLIAPASADTDEPPQDHWLTLSEMGFDSPVPSQAQDAIIVYSINTPIVYSTGDSVEPLETEEEDDGETVISLSTDILFTPDSWDLPDSANDEIEELLTDVPDGADLSVYGHTDSVVGAVDNQELSENRAEAVADVISDVRGDLNLDVQGFADTRPKADESGDDADQARRENRRVELRYES